jgi:hypothetical protein
MQFTEEGRFILKYCQQKSKNEQLGKDLKIFEYFSFQIDEPTNIFDVSKLHVFIYMLFDDGNIKEELLKTIASRGKTKLISQPLCWPSVNVYFHS